MTSHLGTRPFSERLRAGENLRLMEAHSGLSAIIANTARSESGEREFDGLWVSSLTCTASAGLPDLEMTVVDNRLAAIQQIALASDKPLIVDADTGGDISSLRYFCRALRRMSVAGVIVEEKAVPKRNSLEESKQMLADPIDVADKLMAAKAFVADESFLVIARIESLVCGQGVSEALRRALIYSDAGVDGIMIHSKAKTPDEVLEFVSRFRATGRRLPIFCVPTTYNATPATTLFEGGIQCVIYANHQLRAAHNAMESACLSILRDDCTAGLENQITSTKRLFEQTGYTREVEFVDARAASLAKRRLEGQPSAPWPQ